MGNFNGGGGSRGGGFSRGRSGGNSSRGGFGGGNFGPREMHKATCSQCKKECEVPFKPTEGRPVYCKECYASMK